jgi:hypothetical protein
MRWYLAVIALLLLAVPARADPCVTSVTPTIQPVVPGGEAAHVTDVSSTTGQCVSQANFDSRFNDLQNQITFNRNQARAGIAMAMAAASMGVGSAASGAGSGKIAAGLGIGDFQNTVSLSAGIAYAVNKRFNLSGGVSVAPLNGQPNYGVFGGATLILN